jgi:primosomal protein N' (replication factor Y)
VNYVEVAVAKLHTGNKFFSYETPVKLPIGTLVAVPFGKKKAWGIVINIVKKPTFKLKQIEKILDYRLPKISVAMLNWLFDFYPDDNGLITQLFLPPNLSVKPHPQQANLLQGDNKALPTATAEQKSALKIINNPVVSRVLLHGDTATGKTRVFIDKAKTIIASGRSVLILTPEIGLTPQLLTELAKHINAPIVLTHSALTPAERRRVWQYALDSRAPTVFVGPRSVLFLPFRKLGLIVIDEAHDSSYKQSQAPRYQSLFVAGKLASLHKAQLIQSTATPNIDDYVTAQAHGYKIIRMLERAAGSQSSQLTLIDITDRQNFIKSPYISDPLLSAMTAALGKGQQSMLFLNRRGSARSVQCEACGWQALCPKCGLPLTYHHDFHLIRCHSCNFRQAAPNACPLCQSADLVFKSIGTKALVDHIQKLLPRARVIRFDADSSAAEQYYRHIDQLKNGEVDIIIGTQLISKGIDLPNLSVVGVVNADSGLNLPDFRAEETTFQQLYQVTGRTGRGYLPSRSFIQTRLPNHPIMQAAQHRSFEEYYQYELNKRQQFDYPPLCYLAIFKVYKKTALSAETAGQKAFQLLAGQNGLSLLGPSPSFYERPNGSFAWQIIAKARQRSLLVQTARLLTSDWVIDIDPASLL